MGLLVAHFLGFKKPTPKKLDGAGVQELLKMFPSGNIK